MVDLKDYTLAVVANHNVFGFLKQLVVCLQWKGILFRSLCVGDAGLLDTEVEWLEMVLGNRLTRFPLAKQFKQEGIVTQDGTYREIISQRIPFLRYVFGECAGAPVLQLDADTAIIDNDFSLVDPNSDLTLTVREVTSLEHALGKNEKEYPNLGVVFWNRPERCYDFLSAWEVVQRTTNPCVGQFEQGFFYRAMSSSDFSRLSVQRVHCRYYNCYRAKWIESQTSVLHYKGDRRVHRMRSPFYERCRRLNCTAFGVEGPIEEDMLYHGRSMCETIRLF